MADKILICGVNWLGDNVMSMPAVASLKKIYPDCRITVLVKPGQRELWELCGFVNEVMDLRCGYRGMISTISELKKRSFDRAYIFPNSFRSAFIPFAAGIPYRAGFAGHTRSFLITDVINHQSGPDRKHQSWEYMSILGLSDKIKTGSNKNILQLPVLNVPVDIKDNMTALLKESGQGQWIGIMPGAAHGPSKRWPSSYFEEVGRALTENNDFRICVLGSHKEVELCEGIRRSIGDKAISLAGLTTITELAALLAACRVVICNDSGGMHMAVAMGTPVCAVFGATDPSVTGPLGEGNRVIVDPDTIHSRDISPDSGKACQALESIKPERVLNAVFELVKKQS